MNELSKYSNAATESEQTYTHEVLFEQHIPECIQLAVNNFEDFKHQPTHIEQWFTQRIINNPWQKNLPGIGVGIKHNGRLVAFRAIFAQPWWLNGQSTMIAFCANTSVDKQYRGLGLASLLIQHSSQFAAITGSTTAGFITQKAYKKLGYIGVGGSSNDFFRVRVSFQGSLIKRFGKLLGSWSGCLLDLSLQSRDSKLQVKPGFYLEESFHCDEQYDQLWEREKHNYPSCLERSSNYLNWRLFAAPTCQLHLSALYDNSSTLQGFAIWHVQHFSDSISMAVLRDIFYPQHDETYLLTLLALLIKQWRAQGISWANLEVTSAQLKTIFTKLGYNTLHSQGNRYQIHSAFPLSSGTVDNWFRSGLDGDYFDYSL